MNVTDFEWSEIPETKDYAQPPLRRRLTADDQKDERRAMRASDMERILAMLQQSPGRTALVRRGALSRHPSTTWIDKGARAVSRRNPEDPSTFDIYAWWPKGKPAPMQGLAYAYVPAIRRTSGDELPSTPLPPDGPEREGFMRLVSLKNQFEAGRRARGVPADGWSPTELRLIREDPRNARWLRPNGRRANFLKENT